MFFCTGAGCCPHCTHPPFVQVLGEDDVDDEEDEQYLQAADKFEAAYNFR